MPERNPDRICAAFVDMGTTNTRAWLMCGNQVIAETTQSTGIRDAARQGQSAIRECLSRVVRTLQNHPAAASKQPGYLVGAGMIGSNLGLVEVPYIHPPAGLEDLAAAARWYHFPEVLDVPVLLAPGIRSGPPDPAVDSISQMDVMRGEETLCAGLLAIGAIAAPTVVINLGSHWKAIQIGHDKKIQSSSTSLSGELLHVVQSHTILAGSVARERPQKFSWEWIQAGMREQRRSGVGRGLFCTRLLHLASQGSPEDRLAFVAGALIASDLDSLLARGILAQHAQIAVVGHAAISAAWQMALSQADITATIISPEQAQTALLEALMHILVQA
ncbi:MAG TPA: 2-dehydro-3-deoxygalactonokinase, partial [Terriglobales bacterium]|nr:2-dehydro-3-deoxygalactonokinase [Terriglobales bacterium]